MKKLLSALMFTVMISTFGCSEKKESNSQNEETVTSTVETTSETTAPEPVTEKVTEPIPENYVHGDDGYYNIADEYTDFRMRSQEYGTCWSFAGVAGMETSYFKKYGNTIDIEPMGLVDVVYGKDKEEGFFASKGCNPKEIGAWQWIVTETLSRGFGDYTLDSAVIIDTNDHEAIKDIVRNRGGVTICTLDNDLKRNIYFGYHTMNDTTGDSFDHDITVIGWDDHFPKQYFREKATEDGAWICYNSASPSKGYYYVSYCTPMDYAISQSATDKYSDVLSYDAGNEQDKYIKTGSETTTANVFHKSGKLAAVGTYNDFDSQNIKIEIYDSTFTNLLYSQESVLDYHGYHTIELDTPIDVTDYAVAVTYSEGAPVEGESIDYDDIQYVTVSENGQSFVKLDTWYDLSESDIADKLDIDYKPGNCCIKALYVS